MTIWVSENAIAGGRRGELLYVYRFKVWRGKLFSPSNFLQQLTGVFMLLRRGEGARSDHERIPHTSVSSQKTDPISFDYQLEEYRLRFWSEGSRKLE